MNIFELSVDRLSKSYGSKKILDSVSVVYRSGLIHGIIGANGSGKTTFFNCITRNIAFQGSISFSVSLKMGYLPATLFMYPRITGMEFIQFCLSAKNITMEKLKIRSLNELFELPLNSYAETYSTGMLKKLYLLVSVLEKDDILVLDEPFNGLDISAITYITELLLRLKNAGTLILLSSHIIDHLRSFCDTITLIESGQILFVDNKDEFEAVDMRLKAEVQKKFEALTNLSH